jgi:hypothetical protein
MTRVAILVALAGCQGVFGVLGVTALDAPPPPVDAAPFSGPCSRITMLADPLTSPTFSQLMFTSGIPAANVPLLQSGSVLMQMTAEGQSSIASQFFYDVRGEVFTIAVDESSLGAGDAWVVALASQHALVTVQFVRSGTDLVALRTSGAPFELGRVTYDPTHHRFLRFREANGTIFWETSGDGATFATIVSFAVDFITFVQPAVIATRNTGAPAFSITVSNLNGGTPSGVACPATWLRDDFSGATLGDPWARSQMMQATILLTSSTEVSTLTSTAAGFAILQPSTIYALASSQISLEIPWMIDTTTSQALFQVVVFTIDGPAVALRQQQGELVAAKSSDAFASTNITVNQAPYDPAAHRWWRYRHDGTLLYWETSPDGVTYSTFGVANDITGLDRITLQVETYGQVTAMGTPSSAIARFNLGP